MAGRRLFPLACLLLLALGFAADAAHTEQRRYSILVDGKDAGHAEVTILDQDDKSVYVTTSAQVQVQHLIANYNFSIDGQEWWKDGKLVGLKANCNNNGKRCDLTAAPRGEQLWLRVNGTDQYARPDVWPTSYWKLADAKFHNKSVPLLAIESGRELTGQLTYVGPKQLPVSNQLVACYQFRVTGAGGPIELWYDQHHRLVRQEFTEAGHKTIIQLVGKK